MFRDWAASVRLSLAGGVKELRERLCVRKVGLRQMGLGENAGLSQRRVGEMEAGDRFVFRDLRLVRLLSWGECWGWGRTILDT